MLIMTITGTAGTRTRAATSVAPAGTLGATLRPDVEGGRLAGQGASPTHATTSTTDPGHRTAIPLL